MANNKVAQFYFVTIRIYFKLNVEHRFIISQAVSCHPMFGLDIYLAHDDITQFGLRCDLIDERCRGPLNGSDQHRSMYAITIPIQKTITRDFQQIWRGTQDTSSGIFQQGHCMGITG